MEELYRSTNQAENTELNHPPSDPMYEEAAVFMDAPEVPEQENCETESVPVGTVDMQGKKKIYVPELITMTKVFFDKYRLSLYTFLNCNLKRGYLSSLVGERVITPKITHEQCSFTDVEFWRIDREDFYADVGVELKLNTVSGTVAWKGYIVCWCSFSDEDLECSCEELTDDVSGKNEHLDRLSPFLIPYATNKRVDKISEEILDLFQREALKDPKERNARKLAEAMGLTIEYHPIYEHRGVHSVVFFKEDPLEIGEDREEEQNGKKKHIKAAKSDSVIIPANTIVINTNVVNQDYSSFDIYHEIYHYYEHYLFFRLQEMDNNDLRQVKVKEVIVEEGYDQKDPIYFMEKQANRGGYGLMMPVTDTRIRIDNLRKATRGYRHAGERYESIGIELRKELVLPDFRIRARMIQLGNIEAKGALNYVARRLIRPFAFDRDALREDQHTFVVEEAVVNRLRKNNPELNDLFVSGKYVYADGHAVINNEKCVKKAIDQYSGDEKYFLTDWAEAHVDDCCLRFVRLYVQQHVGRYVYGRMYCDNDYLKQTQFFLEDYINKGQMDELDAKYEYKKDFPTDFTEAFNLLRTKRNISLEKMAELLNMDDSTFKRWLKDRSKYRNEDFLTELCLILETPDWISELLFKRAGIQLDEDDKRQRALARILRVQSADGIQAANAYLKECKLDPLSI